MIAVTGCERAEEVFRPLGDRRRRNDRFRDQNLTERGCHGETSSPRRRCEQDGPLLLDPVQHRNEDGYVGGGELLGRQTREAAVAQRLSVRREVA